MTKQAPDIYQINILPWIKVLYFFSVTQKNEHTKWSQKVIAIVSCEYRKQEKRLEI